MSYQVLARKWRPKRFAELVGQDHVVRALSHALDSGRIHHAFLFTGTRGVGKTTIARIFAKSLNCEKGVGANPCGVCGACTDIDAGRYVDLLEIDAASRTKVDDTREMLDNVVYAPARGQYKVYLIDEVHMLSGHSFNALLKTLEEPPPHVKFLLATTDPQKLPVTVLSRCLQFNLKRLSDEQIAGQVEKILGAEGVAHDAASVSEIARAGNGSLRDALSLLDQAIAFGGGALRADDVRSMLGTIDRAQVAGLLDAIVSGDAATLYARIEALAEFAPDFAAVLDELALLLHRIQLTQFVPDAGPGEAALAEAVPRLAARCAPEEVQLLYQLAISGRRDLPLAPSPRSGFEMALLRMLAFRPAQAPGEQATPRATNAVAPTTPSTISRGAPVQPPASASPAAPAAPSTTAAVVAAERIDTLDAARWRDLAERIDVRGPLRELVSHAVPQSYADGALKLLLPSTHEHLRGENLVRQLAQALQPLLGATPRISIEVVSGTDVAQATIAAQRQRERDARQARAEAAVAADPAVQDMLNQFGGRVVTNSTRPIDGN
jgi:DNA polymerase-3 subunit gamma/tau